MGGFLELLGTINRLPGTALVAEDEFMKGIMYRMELERIAQVNYNKHLQLKPDDVEGAEKIFLQTVNNPDNATVAMAKESMLEQHSKIYQMVLKFQSTLIYQRLNYLYHSTKL